MSRKTSLKSGRPPAAISIIVKKTTKDSRKGYSDIYGFKDRGGNAAGQAKASSGDIITWYCDQPFTFLAADESHWDPVRDWKPLPLTDGTAFMALNSIVAAPPQPGLPKNSLTLPVNGNPGDARRYTITIPQIDLKKLTLRKGANTPPDNTLVRATVILQ
jgi:hypothetical protein